MHRTPASDLSLSWLTIASTPGDKSGTDGEGVGVGCGRGGKGAGVSWVDAGDEGFLPSIYYQQRAC